MSSPRNFEIDLARAFALLTIFINHIPGTIFEYLTFKNFGFSDSAEIFVLLSGMALALSYYPKFQKGQYLLCLLKLWRRAGVLYCAHIVITLITLSIFCAAALWGKNPLLLNENNIYAVIHFPIESLLGIGILGHQLGYNNILPLYSVLLLAAPLILYGMHRNIYVTFFISFLLWLFCGVFQIAFPNYPISGFWFLNPLSWQFLFLIGVAFVIYGKIKLPFWIVLLSVFYLVGACIFIQTSFWGHVTWFGLPPVLGGFDKTFLSLFRLIHILALVCLVYYIGILKILVRFIWIKPFLLLGKYSLNVFLAGTILAMIAQVLHKIFPASIILDLFLIFGGILIQIFLVYYLEWFSRYKALSRESVPLN